MTTIEELRAQQAQLHKQMKPLQDQLDALSRQYSAIQMRINRERVKAMVLHRILPGKHDWHGDTAYVHWGSENNGCVHIQEHKDMYGGSTIASFPVQYVGERVGSDDNA